MSINDADGPGYPEGITLCGECHGDESPGCKSCDGAGFLFNGTANPSEVGRAFYRRREKEVAAKIAAGGYDENRDGPTPWQKSLYAKCGACGEVWKVCNLPMSISLVARAAGRAVCPGCGAVKNLFIATSKEAAEHGKTDSAQHPKA